MPKLQAQPVLVKPSARKLQCTQCPSSVCISLALFKGALSTGKLTTGDESLFHALQLSLHRGTLQVSLPN